MTAENMPPPVPSPMARETPEAASGFDPDGRWIQTASGKALSLLKPRPHHFTWNDMCNHLAKTNRYVGATDVPYSVAQHSCLVCDNLPPELRTHGLLHDGHEAFLGDWSTPLKRALGAIDEWAADALFDLERRMVIAVHRKARITLPDNLDGKDLVEINTADQRALATEVRDLMATPPHDWVKPSLPFPKVIKAWPWAKAADEFMDRLNLYVIKPGMEL